jgi:CheY-like chemotaxis protein
MDGCRRQIDTAERRGDGLARCNKTLITRLEYFWASPSLLGCVVAPGQMETGTWYLQEVHVGKDSVKSGRSRRVVLVDDYADARTMYKEHLQLLGFDVIEAANGIEALRAVHCTGPDIILMDLSMPVMDGWEATRRLKADERTADIPVIAVSAETAASVSAKARKAGFQAFVSKPCLLEELSDEMERALAVASGVGDPERSDALPDSNRK